MHSHHHCVSFPLVCSRLSCEKAEAFTNRTPLTSGKDRATCASAMHRERGREARKETEIGTGAEGGLFARAHTLSRPPSCQVLWGHFVFPDCHGDYGCAANQLQHLCTDQTASQALCGTPSRVCSHNCSQQLLTHASCIQNSTDKQIRTRMHTHARTHAHTHTHSLSLDLSLDLSLRAGAYDTGQHTT